MLLNAMDQNHSASQQHSVNDVEGLSEESSAMSRNVSLLEEKRSICSYYNVRSPAVKRIFKECQEMRTCTEDGIYAKPLESNIFEWHFTILGTPETAFEHGLYHGRIILPAEYPMKPPAFIMLTPSGRFETNVKICLSMSSFHPETWQPSWSIRTALLGLRSYMDTSSPGAIGSLDYPDEEKRRLARQSHFWTCPDPECGPSFNNPLCRVAAIRQQAASNGPSALPAQPFHLDPNPVPSVKDDNEGRGGTEIESNSSAETDPQAQQPNVNLIAPQHDQTDRLCNSMIAVGIVVFLIIGIIIRRILNLYA